MDHVEREQVLRCNTSGNILADIFDSFREAQVNPCDEPYEKEPDLDTVAFCQVCGERILITVKETKTGTCHFCEML